MAENVTGGCKEQEIKFKELLVKFTSVYSKQITINADHCLIPSRDDPFGKTRHSFKEGVLYMKENLELNYFKIMYTT